MPQIAAHNNPAHDNPGRDNEEPDPMTAYPLRQATEGRALIGPEPRLSARTAELLAARIGDGSLPPGTPLLESRLAAMLGTSRGPARHALAMLARRGLVTRSEGRGYVVAGTPAGT
ncbi:winged helix-turn-helix domain-containing protein, partial [Elioraea sp.]|uniref:winged helix-turn-helix domain-containing protein n=1 Tax=Elioraea sp. TaxID=2185103 RepID=UPI0025C5EB8B